MKKSVPIKFTEDHSCDKLIDMVWNAKEKQETPPISHDEGEKIVSATFDWKTIAIFILSTILLGALLGYNIQDRGMQEALDTIQRENKIIWSENRNIAISQKAIINSESKIENNKKILKDKYSIIYR